MHMLERSEHPDFVFCDRPAERAHIVLAGERLLGIGRRVLNREAGVERCRALVESRVAVPLVGAVLGGDHDRPGRGPAGVGIFIRRAHGKFLNAIGREILQEATDPVVGVVGAVDRQFVVQARASAGRNSGDSRFGRIGRLDRLGSGHKVSDVGEAARRERKSFQVPAADDALMHRTRRVNRLGRYR